MIIYKYIYLYIYLHMVLHIPNVGGWKPPARVSVRCFHQGKVSCCVHDAMGFGFSGVIDYARGDYKPLAENRGDGDPTWINMTGWWLTLWVGLLDSKNNDWLVVTGTWLWFFHSGGNFIIPIDSFFLDGLKPPTRWDETIKQYQTYSIWYDLL